LEIRFQLARLIGKNLFNNHNASDKKDNDSKIKLDSNMSKKIKIAYVTTPITFGGSERVNLNFLKNFDRDKFIIVPILFVRSWQPDTYYEFELKKLELAYITIPVAKSKKRDLFRVIRCFIKLKKLIHGDSYDLIHTHGYLADLLGYLVSKAVKLPIISTCHGFIYEGMKLILYYNLDIRVLRCFDKVISVSAPLKADLINKNVPADKIALIENSPELTSKNNMLDTRYILRNKFRVESNEILLGYIGRLSEEKGLCYLLESIKMLDYRTHKFKLILIGEGCQDTKLKALSNNYRISSKVIFAGFQKDIDSWLAAIDIFVLPSLTEGTPMVLLEAMSHGVPCIASAVGGVPLLIESGVDGILVQPGNPDEIYKAIYSISTDITKRDNIIKNARCKIERKYNIIDWTKKIETEYIKLANLSTK